MYTIHALLYRMIVIPMADKVPKDWRNIGPNWNFPFASFIKLLLGWGFAVTAIAGVALALFGFLLGAIMSMRGTEGAGKAWFGFFLGLILVTLGLGGSALFFDLANLVKIKA